MTSGEIKAKLFFKFKVKSFWVTSKWNCLIFEIFFRKCLSFWQYTKTLRKKIWACEKSENANSIKQYFNTSSIFRRDWLSLLDSRNTCSRYHATIILPPHRTSHGNTEILLRPQNCEKLQPQLSVVKRYPYELWTHTLYILFSPVAKTQIRTAYLQVSVLVENSNSISAQTLSFRQFFWHENGKIREDGLAQHCTGNFGLYARFRWGTTLQQYAIFQWSCSVSFSLTWFVRGTLNLACHGFSHKWFSNFMTLSKTTNALFARSFLLHPHCSFCKKARCSTTDLNIFLCNKKYYGKWQLKLQRQIINEISTEKNKAWLIILF